MTEELPAPLVPSHVDLRGYEFMPLYGDRLKKSETWISASHEGKVAALNLWWHAYGHECPAGSLPDDDKLLADYAGYGSVIRAWRKIKDQALRGWKKCSDGRLYHAFMAEIVMKAWEIKLADQARTAKGRITILEKRKSLAVTDEEKAHIDGLLQTERQRLSQCLSQTLLPTRSRQDRTGQDITKNLNSGADAPDAADAARAPPLPDCPHDRIIALYHEILPMCPRVIEWHEARRTTLRTRWREKSVPNGTGAGYRTLDDGLAYWKRFFEYCSQSDFLTGRAHSRDSKPFLATLEWLIKPSNFAKVLEGNYHS
jgi:hypothetical protein